MKKTSTFDEKKALQLLSQGSEYGFAQILDRYQRRVFNTAFKFLKSREHALEIVQEVFLRVWTRRIAFADVQNLEAFIVTMAANQTYKYWEKLTNERSAQYEFVVSRGTLDNSTEHSISERQNEDLLNQTLDLLPPQQRLVYQLSRIDGLTHEDIAARLKISSRTVNYHITCALKLLRQHLEPHISVMALPLLLKIFDQ